MPRSAWPCPALHETLNPPCDGGVIFNVHNVYICFATLACPGFKPPAPQPPPARPCHRASLLPFSPAFFPALTKKKTHQHFAVQRFPWQHHFPIFSARCLASPPAPVTGPKSTVGVPVHRDGAGGAGGTLGQGLPSTWTSWTGDGAAGAESSLNRTELMQFWSWPLPLPVGPCASPMPYPSPGQQDPSQHRGGVGPSGPSLG